LFGLWCGREDRSRIGFASPVTHGPALDGGPGVLEPRSDLGGWNFLVDNQLRDLRTGARGQGCVSVRHTRAFLAVDTFASPTQPARPSLAFTLPDRKPSTNLPGQYTWRDRIAVVALDPSAVFKKAITGCLPKAHIAVDPFRLVQLGNQCLPRVRQRLAHQTHHCKRPQDRPGLGTPETATTRLRHPDDSGTITSRSGVRQWMIQPVSWAPHGSKEGVRLILASTTVEQTRTAKARFDAWATAAGTNETTRLAAPITAWWPHIEVTITTSVTNARTEAANTTIKHIKHTGRGYRNNTHYQTRTLLRSTHRERQHRLTSQGTTPNCEITVLGGGVAERAIRHRHGGRDTLHRRQQRT